MTALDLNAELFFPDEIMFEILSRLTVASLLRCKCVCKRWNEIIQHPKFIEMQMVWDNDDTLYFTSKDGTAETFTILDSYHGLLVEKSEISGMYRVRNPATKQILALPEPQEALMSMSILFLPFTNSYKLVCIYYRKDKIGKCSCKILSLGGSDLSWRALEDSYFHELDARTQTICHAVEGTFFYCIGLATDGSSDSQILSLDVETEIITGSPLSVPKSFFLNWEGVWLMEWDEKVALYSIMDEELHVWVLENLIQRKWAEKKIIVPLTFLKENPDMKETLVPYMASTEVIWFLNGNVQVIGYDIKSKTVLRYESPPPEKISCGTASLVTLKGMQPENKEHTVGKQRRRRSVGALFRRWFSLGKQRP